MTSNQVQKGQKTSKGKVARLSEQTLEGEQVIQSAVSLKQGSFSRTRVPSMLQSTLKEQRKVSKPNTPSEDEGSQPESLTDSLRLKLKKTVDRMRKVTICQICQGEMVQRNNWDNKKIYISQCVHKYLFCESCLHHYVIYKVNNFQQVHCPMEGCPDTLQMTSRFFKSLPNDIQRKYKKLYQFQLVSKDPTIKLCPKNYCEGIIRSSGKAMEEQMTCDTCKRKFCGKCLLTYHEGDCRKQELKHFKKNLRYRQCQMCGCIIEKDSGCNHMKCLCSYQFCYICSQKWDHTHVKCQGLAAQTPQPEINVTYSLCLCCLSPGCLTPLDCCFLGTALKYLLKLILLVLYIGLMLPTFVFGCLPFSILMLGLSFLHGIFCYPFDFLKSIVGPGACCLLVVFFPIVIVSGVYHAICDFVCNKSGNLWKMCGQILRNGIDKIVEA